jgi:hypothetical protein
VYHIRNRQFNCMPQNSFRARLCQSQINQIRIRYNKGELFCSDAKEQIEDVVSYAIYSWHKYSKVPCDSQDESVFRSQLNATL